MLTMSRKRTPLKAVAVVLAIAPALEVVVCLCLRKRP
jgi:hypothetical protein